MIFQREGLGLLQLDKLPLVEDQGGKSDQGREQKTRLLSASDITASGVFPVELAGASYKLFVQPLRLSLQGGAESTDLREGAKSNTIWILCGLVRSSRFRNESWAVSNPLLLLFLFTFAVVITGWSLVKLWSLGPGDELRLTDVGLLCVSVLVVSSLLAFFLLDIYAYHQQRRQLDQQLQNFAEEMAGNFSKELEQLYQMLERMNNRLKVEGVPVPPDNRKARILCEIPHCSQPTWLLADDPIFKNGKQFAKWAIGKATTPLIRVDQRAYFRNIVEERGWRLRKTAGGEGFDFFLDPILSWNSGEPQPELSMPGPRNTDGGLMWVTTATPELISLLKVVMPPGFDYAVLENGGKLMFAPVVDRYVPLPKPVSSLPLAGP